MPHRLHLLTFGGLHILPVLHYRLEFAHLAREGVERVRPDCIALELPATLQDPFLRALRRLPQASVIGYPTRGGDAYLMIEPCDPLVEGGRLALERGIPLQLVDVDLDEYPLSGEPLPDSYAVHRVGLAAYHREYAATLGAAEPEAADLRRERGMAWRLQELTRRYGRVLLICGMHHAERVGRLFGEPQTRPLERVRREDLRLYNLHPDSCVETMGEPPFLSALHELRRAPLPPEPQAVPPLRRRFSAFELISGGKGAVSEQEIFFASLVRAARGCGGEGSMPDRQRAILRLFHEASRHYRQETGEPVHLWQKRAFFRFSRNYALLSGML
ncbi:MAG TPA: hypothetical protein VNX25_00845, partial [Verrucomicrobiae bacterium]|nr:hypothetical protein [Verrucomicrobiae bacterium]